MKTHKNRKKNSVKEKKYKNKNYEDKHIINIDESA